MRDASVRNSLFFELEKEKFWGVSEMFPFTKITKGSKRTKSGESDIIGYQVAFTIGRRTEEIFDKMLELSTIAVREHYDDESAKPINIEPRHRGRTLTIINGGKDLETLTLIRNYDEEDVTPSSNLKTFGEGKLVVSWVIRWGLYNATNQDFDYISNLVRSHQIRTLPHRMASLAISS